MGISMPNMNGLEASKIISKQFPGVRIVIMSQHDSEHMMNASAVPGASAFVTKSQVGRDLVITLQKVAEKLSDTR